MGIWTFPYANMLEHVENLYDRMMQHDAYLEEFKQKKILILESENRRTLRKYQYCLVKLSQKSE